VLFWGLHLVLSHDRLFFQVCVDNFLLWLQLDGVDAHLLLLMDLDGWESLLDQLDLRFLVEKLLWVTRVLILDQHLLPLLLDLAYQLTVLSLEPLDLILYSRVVLRTHQVPTVLLSVEDILLLDPGFFYELL